MKKGEKGKKRGKWKVGDTGGGWEKDSSFLIWKNLKGVAVLKKKCTQDETQQQ